MLFNSYEFILIFVPVVLAIYFLLSSIGTFGNVARKIFLLGASLFFYAWWSVDGALLLIISTIITYSIGTLLSINRLKSSRQTILLCVGIFYNIGLLAFFKYFDFFIYNVNTIFGYKFNYLHIILPLGLSFFVFQKIAFLVDSWKGDVGKRDFLDFCLFVFFFPQLVAGPIVHHKEMIPQFESWNWRHLHLGTLSAGLFMLALGLSKKTVAADTLAIPADAGFASAVPLGFADAWLTALAYTFQLYFDFSGYSDMAVGVALMFNIRLPFNFESPYRALSIQDFWRRWHITLSRFLRDYLFIPLGGNRTTPPRLYANLFTVFLIGGLWHGASWMFVMWGALHGVGMIVHRVWQSHVALRIPDWLAWFVTFLFVTVTWVFFRAPDMKSAENVLLGMVGARGWGTVAANVAGNYTLIAVSLLACLLLPNSRKWLEKFRPSVAYTAMTCVLMLTGLLFIDRTSTFLYWSF